MNIKDLDMKLHVCRLSEYVTKDMLKNIPTDEDTYTNKIVEALYMLEEQKEETVNTQVGNSKSLKLPYVELPQFSNLKGDNLSDFFRSFEAIMAKHNISEYEKFVLLKKQVSGGARALVDSLQPEQQEFKFAKELLSTAFDSTISSKEDLLRKMEDLNLRYNDDPYTFIGHMKSVISSAKTLEVTRDDILQYFVWKSMNDRFQSHLTQITNSSSPSLEEIESNIFEAAKRYVKQKNRFKDQKRPRNAEDLLKETSTTMAANVQHRQETATTMATNVHQGKPKIPCWLCKSDNKNSDHAMRDCKSYITPKMKVDKLKQIKACAKCSFKNHTTPQCTYKFSSNCRNCNGEHLTHLCLKEATSPKISLDSSLQ